MAELGPIWKIHLIKWTHAVQYKIKPMLIFPSSYNKAPKKYQQYNSVRAKNRVSEMCKGTMILSDTVQYVCMCEWV